VLERIPGGNVIDCDFAGVVQPALYDAEAGEWIDLARELSLPLVCPQGGGSGHVIPASAADRAVSRGGAMILHPFAHVAGQVEKAVAGALRDESAVGGPVVIPDRSRAVVERIAAAAIVGVGGSEAAATEPIGVVRGTVPGGRLVPLVERGGLGRALIHGKPIPRKVVNEALSLRIRQILCRPRRRVCDHRPPVGRHASFDVGTLVGGQSTLDRQPVAVFDRPIPAHTDDRMVCPVVDQNVLADMRIVLYGTGDIAVED